MLAYFITLSNNRYKNYLRSVKASPLGDGGLTLTVQQVFIIGHLFYCTKLKRLPGKAFSIGTTVGN